MADMPSMADEVKQWGEAGGILVRVEFLDAAGNVEETLPDRVATDFRLSPVKFAYLPMEQERPHFVDVHGFWKDGDEWVLQSEGKRVVLGPMWNDKQLKEAKAWKTSHEFPDGALEEMDEIYNEM